MQFDIARQIGAVTRQVADRDYEGRMARVVVATRSYAAPIEDTWDALTNAERIPRWFLPISGELRLGGRYQLETNAGGTITTCEPPRHLAVTWEFGGSTSFVIVRLTEEGPESTLLELEHIAYAEEEFFKFWDQFGPGAVGVGWDLSLFGLARHVEDGETFDHRASHAWLTGEDGKAFMSESSDAWGEASAAFGTDRAAARAAAERTTAFYTGGEEGGTGG